jgi:translocator protein
MDEKTIVNDYAGYTTSTPRRKKRKRGPAWIPLACFLAICFAAIALDAHIARPALHGWYLNRLVKPKFAPPNWLFIPVWTILYATIAVAVWRVWREGSRAQRTDGMVLFAIQLILDFAWTFFVFNQHRLLVSTIIVLALWLAVVAMIALYWRVQTLAGAILLPYLGWVSFIIALNLVLLRHN